MKRKKKHSKYNKNNTTQKTVSLCRVGTTYLRTSIVLPQSIIHKTNETRVKMYL